MIPLSTKKGQQMPAKKDPKDKKDQVISFNVTKAYFDWLVEYAKERDVSVSFLIRQALKKHIPVPDKLDGDDA
jgi:hypothetical protein